MDFESVASSAPNRSPAPPFAMAPRVDQAQQPALPPLSPIAQIRQSYAAGIRPDTRLLVSEWADRHRRLPKKSSAEPGPWRTSRTPYLREIMDCMSATSEVEEVVVMKASQVAGTEAILNALGYLIDHAPGPVILVQPTVELAKRFSRQRLDPLLIDTPNLARKVAESRARDSGNTMLSKDFPGGQLIVTGANSAVGLRSMPAQCALMDEIDGYPGDVDEEGSPIDLVEARQRTFARRKRMKVSTPTIEGRSAIEAAYAASDQRRFYVPCPACGEMQPLEFARLVWTKLLLPPERAVYECCACGAAIQNHQKTGMLAAGEWRTRRSVLLREAAAVLARADGGVHDPEVRREYDALIAEAGEAEPAGGKVRGYHLNALYAPVGWMSWGEIALAFSKAYRDPEKHRAFVNTVLGECWSSQGGEAPAWEGLKKRVEHYTIGTIPIGVLLLTAGVDVQKDRLIYEVVGWGRGRRSWSIDSAELPGDTADIDRGPWGQLDALLARVYPHAGGVEMPIRMLAVDSGYNTQTVYNWVRRYPLTRVIAVKGRDEAGVLVGSPTAVDVSDRGRKLKRAVKVWPVGVSMAKAEFYGWLRLEVSPDPRVGAPAGYCHFPEYGDEYFKQITAEQLVAHKTRKGFTRLVWELIPGRQNHGLDARIYARAAAFVAGLDRFQENDWAARERMVGSDRAPAVPALQLVSVGAPAAPAVPPAAARRRVHRSRYLGGESTR
jgi:phage terminase large subunit GpA-like protein